MGLNFSFKNQIQNLLSALDGSVKIHWIFNVKSGPDEAEMPENAIRLEKPGYSNSYF